MDFRRFQEGDFEPHELIVPIGLLVLVLIAIFLAFSSYYTVQPNEQAVVLRFGKFHTTALPGLHYKIPLVDQVLKVSIEEHSMNLPFGTGPARPTSRPSEEETLMLTGDLNAASVEWSVQWKVSEPKDYLFSFHDPEDPRYLEKVIMTAAQSVMNRLVGDYSIDEVLTKKRTEIAADAQEETQRILDEYECGIRITDLQMQRVTPPDKVKPAFDHVNAAIQKQDQLENEAIRERNELLPAAKAEADKKVQEAKGYADRRVAEAQGKIEALKAKFAAYQQAPEVTRLRLYLEAMQEVMGNVDNKVILDADLKQVLPLLQLEENQQ